MNHKRISFAMMQRHFMRESTLLLLVLYIYTVPRMMVNRQFYLINDRYTGLDDMEFLI